MVTTSFREPEVVKPITTSFRTSTKTKLDNRVAAEEEARKKSSSQNTV
jgi:hypothetical protein